MLAMIGALRSAAKTHSPLAAAVREMRFLKEWATHRKLIRQYRLPRGRSNTGRVVETPLLIGYFETSFGLGEYARGLASALDAVGAPFAVYPYNSYTRRDRDEASWARLYDVDRVHSVNIFCMAADQTYNARRIIGKRHTERSYNILNAFWELPRAPESWRSDLEFFDELWVPNQFVANAFRPIFPKRIVVISPCVDFEMERVPNRSKFGLDAAKFYFLLSFDFNSYPERKNPSAVVAAFEAAFGSGRDDIGLIFKTAGARHLFPKIASGLEAAAKRDRRITLLHGNWKRADVLALLASVDCFVSLHRSEGFGFGMAEAMFLGKPVIATDFSGNAEFLTAATGYPVPCQMRPVEEGEYPHYTGNLWAEPDVQVAAEIMRSVASKTEGVRDRALRGQAYIRAHYSPEIVGRSVAARLQELVARLQAASHG